MANNVGYNKLVAVILQKYRDNGKPINLSEARKKADKISKKINLDSDSDILSAVSKA
jgi:hypothetical protein